MVADEEAADEAFYSESKRASMDRIELARDCREEGFFFLFGCGAWGGPDFLVLFRPGAGAGVGPAEAV